MYVSADSALAALCAVLRSNTDLNFSGLPVTVFKNGTDTAERKTKSAQMLGAVVSRSNVRRSCAIAHICKASSAPERPLKIHQGKVLTKNIE